MTVLLFAGSDYDTVGGWHDFVGQYDTSAGAKRRIDASRKVTVYPARTSTFDTTLVTSTSSVFDNTPRPKLKVGDPINDGRVIAIDGDMATAEFPERTEVSWDYDWAQIVADGKIIEAWSGGVWEDR